jgi:transcriptional regulator with XRE-family HTH domain
MKDIGFKIRRYREARNYTQEFMASQLNISQGSYAKIENNQTKITFERLKDISDLLEIDLSTFLASENHNTFNMSNNQTANGFIESYYGISGSLESLLVELKELIQEIRLSNTGSRK